MSNLKPCPFCDETKKVSEIYQSPYGTAFFVRCGACWIVGPKGVDAGEAIKLWNQRPATPPQDLSTEGIQQTINRRLSPFVNEVEHD